MKVLDKQSKDDPAYGVGGDKIVYSIEGDNTELLKVMVDPDWKKMLFCDPSNVVYTRGDIQPREFCFSVKNPDLVRKCDRKIFDVLKRLLIGGSICLTYYRAGEKGGIVGFAGNYPGSILPIRLFGETIFARHNVFVAAYGDVALSIDFFHETEALLSGFGVMMEKFTGDGILFIHAGGDLFGVTLRDNEKMEVEYSSLVAWDNTVNVNVQLSGLKSTMSGIGVFMTTLTGPGTVIIETMSLAKTRHHLMHGSYCGPLPLLVAQDLIGRMKRFFKLGV
ncbi:MAG TPA: AIM24 family protein [Thermodesulfovibrionia bacterium]|nr:AIM24 family protein [Thermodesulfovibrionia bacterium]